jgi:hypothetical protein
MSLLSINIRKYCEFHSLLFELDHKKWSIREISVQPNNFNLVNYKFQSRQPGTTNFTSQSYSLLHPIFSNADHLFCSKESSCVRTSLRNSRTSSTCYGPAKFSTTTSWFPNTCTASSDLKFLENGCLLGKLNIVTSAKERRKSSKGSKLAPLWFGEAAQNLFRFVFELA